MIEAHIKRVAEMLEKADANPVFYETLSAEDREVIDYLRESPQPLLEGGAAIPFASADHFEPANTDDYTFDRSKKPKGPGLLVRMRNRVRQDMIGTLSYVAMATMGAIAAKTVYDVVTDDSGSVHRGDFERDRSLNPMDHQQSLEKMVILWASDINKIRDSLDEDVPEEKRMKDLLREISPHVLKSFLLKVFSVFYEDYDEDFGIDLASKLVSETFPTLVVANIDTRGTISHKHDALIIDVDGIETAEEFLDVVLQELIHYSIQEHEHGAMSKNHVMREGAVELLARKAGDSPEVDSYAAATFRAYLLELFDKSTVRKVLTGDLESLAQDPAKFLNSVVQGDAEKLEALAADFLHGKGDLGRFFAAVDQEVIIPLILEDSPSEVNQRFAAITLLLNHYNFLKSGAESAPRFDPILQQLVEKTGFVHDPELTAIAQDMDQRFLKDAEDFELNEYLEVYQNGFSEEMDKF